MMMKSLGAMRDSELDTLNKRLLGESRRKSGKLLREVWRERGRRSGCVRRQASVFRI
jgi:hypothetical protein